MDAPSGRPQGPSKAPPPPINQFIKADRVRLIAPGDEIGEDKMLGIFSLSEALQQAEQYEMDLVMINDKGDPPVCKIIDYGKYKYSQEKKKKENMKKQIKVDIKEVKMSYKIDQHDFEVRMRAVQKFLADGDRVSKLLVPIYLCPHRVVDLDLVVRTSDRNIFIIPYVPSGKDSSTI